MTRSPLTGLRLALAVGLLLAALVAAVGATEPSPAAAASMNRVGLVVDTGDGQVKKMCVTFAEASISGAEVLRRADVNAVFANYGGQGTAVCSLCHTGCPSSNCLTCDPDGRYWAYSRAPWGASSYQYSRAGAGSTTVGDGDVEAWAWGSGRPPVYASFAELCGGPAPTRPASGGTAGGGSGGGGSASPATTSPPTTAAPSGGPASTVAGGSSARLSPSTTAVTPRQEGGPAPAPAAAGDRVEPGEGGAPAPAAQAPGGAAGIASGHPEPPTPPRNGSPAGVALGVAVSLAVGAWAVILRRRRRLPVAPVVAGSGPVGAEYL